MNYYTANYPLGFPSSEYGGIYVIAADSEEECIEFILKSLGSYEVLSILGGDLELNDEQSSFLDKEKIDLLPNTILDELRCNLKEACSVTMLESTKKGILRAMIT